MKNKVGIVCNYYIRNYGSVLQCYATQKAIELLGYESEMIQFKNIPDKKAKYEIMFRMKLKRMLSVKAISKKVETTIAKKQGGIFEQLKQGRGVTFDCFIKNNCTMSTKCHNQEEVIRLSKEYDVLLLGSDQLLNPKDIIIGYHSMRHISNEVKKISYAPSFGVSNLPEFVKKKAKKDLERFAHLSVREKTGAKIVKELIGKDVPVVLDPTLLLSKEDWEVVAGENAIINGPYIFFYFMGRDKTHREFVKTFSELTGLKVVGIPHINNYVKFDMLDISVNYADPAEFMNLIKNAQYVLTDSFHASIFSMLFHTPFFVFERFHSNDPGSTNSRLETLLQTVGLEHLKKTGTEDVRECIEDNINFKDVDKKIDVARAISFNYLKEALDS